MGDRRSRLFCLTDQRRALLSDLERFLDARPTLVTVGNRNPESIMGVREGTFINIATHPVQPTEELWDRLRYQGFIIVTLSDTWMREMYARKS